MKLYGTRCISAISILILLSLLLAETVFGESLETQNKYFVAAFYPEKVDWNPLTTYSATEAQLYTAVYEGLLTYNPNTLRPVPAVASRFEISPDKKTYTFFIRPEAKFWDGTPISAKIFKDSWLRVLDPSVKAPFAGLLDSVKGAMEYRTGKNKDPNSVAIKVVNNQTLSVELNAPTAYFVQILCHQSLVPIHPSLLNMKNWNPKTPIVGNGPYKFVTRQNDEIELHAFEDYWDKANVQINDIKLIFLDDPDQITNRFNDGEINWIESGANFDKLIDQNSFHFTPQFSTTFLYFSNDKLAYRNPLVRKGLTMMLPFDQIRSKQMFIMPSSQLIPDIPDYPVANSIAKTDLQAGLKLLEKAGFPKGKGLPPITLLFPKSDTWHQIAGLMKKSWKDLDVKVVIKESEAENLFDTVNPSDYTVTTISWVGDYADPMTFLDLWSSTSSLNRSGFSNSEFDKLLKDSNNQQGKERLTILSKAEEFLLSNAQVIPINHSPSFNVIDLNQVDGWFENALNVHPFKYLQFKTLKPPRSVAMR